MPEHRPPLAAMAAIFLLALFPVFARAQATLRDVRAGAGADVVKKPGMPMVSLSADAISFMAWDNNLNFGAGLSYPFGKRDGWNGSVGAILVQRLDDDIGTHLNFLFRGSYCGETVCLSYAHISHGSGLGIEVRKANSGLNFVFLEYRLR